MSRLSLFRRRPFRHLVPWSLLSLLGCGGLSNGDLPPSDALVLDINGERSVDHVRDSLLVTVQATGASPDKVELIHEGQVLATLIPPFQYTWVTVDKKEGRYQLSARTEWKGATFSSKPHTVFVDRTPPRVEQMLPVGDNVSVKESRELRITFSEPMLESSLRDDQVKIGEYAYTKGTLSEDGRVLVVPNNYSGLGKDEATLNLEGPTDLAGNALFQAGGQTTLSWSWSRPKFWVDSASEDPNVSYTVTDGVSLALGADGNPLVAYSARRTVYDGPLIEGERLMVKRWSGSGWTLVGTTVPAVPPAPTLTVRNPRMVLGTDSNPVVAFIQGGEGDAQDSLQVVRWDGADWKPLGARVTAPEVTKVHGAALAMDRDGRPVVAWSAADGIHVARWEADRWADVGGLQRATLVGEGSLAAEAPALAVDADNHLVVAWTESERTAAADLYVRRWNGTTWESLGGKVEPAHTQDLTARFPTLLITNNQPSVVWSMRHPSYSSEKTPVFGATWSGTSWGIGVVPSSMALKEDRGTAVALDDKGRVLYAWNGSYEWTGTGFQGGIRVSWHESEHGAYSDALGFRGSDGPLSLVVDARNQPMMAWRESGIAYVSWKNE
ncbi:Ig-like domain-containing protein [Pyxidicoccus sp. 3LFB2]